MKTVKPGFQVIREPNLSLKIERIARICYKSEDKIREGSDVRMIQNLVERNHLAMLEHGSVCVKVPWVIYNKILTVRDWIEQRADKEHTLKNCFIRMTANHRCPSVYDDLNTFLVSGNIRAWLNFFKAWNRYCDLLNIKISKQFLEEVSAMCPAAFGTMEIDERNLDYTRYDWCYVMRNFLTFDNEERMVHEDVSVLFTCDRGVTHELVRHRPASFAQESTRYCNYSLDKTDNQVTYIEPFFYNQPGREEEYNAWRSAMEDAEKYYLGLIERGSKPQEARSVLPHSTKVDIVITANLQEWKHIFELRACEMTGKAHPQMREVMCPLFRDMREEYPFAFGDMVLPEEIIK